jgi:hypothetical protein
MSNKFQTFDLWNPVVEDFDYETQARVNELRRRWIDNHTWGVVRDNAYPLVITIPVSPISPRPNLKWTINQFPIKLDIVNGRVNVGEGSTQSVNPSVLGGVGYDINGERIAILADANFDFSNDVPEGKASSGNINIPLTLSGVTGDCNANPSVPGTYYLWIEYLEINNVAPTVGEDGAIHYPKIEDGYRIRLTGTPDSPSGDGVSIFLAKIIWVGGAGFLTVTDVDGDTLATDGSNSVDTAPIVAGDPKRVYSAVRDNVVEIVVDETNKTAVYASGLLGNLRDHINAIGGGSPTPNNPHGLTLADIPGAGEEPVATNNQNDSFAKGIVDKNAAQNSPASNGDALQPFIEVTGLTPTVLDATATSAGITSTPKVQWIRIKDLDNATKTKAAFVLGFRLKSLYPNLRQSNLSSDPSINPSDPESGDGWVGFNNAEDTPGVYRIYGTKATLSTGVEVLLLNKELLAGWPAAILPLTDDKLAIGQVYWDGVTVFRNPVEPSTSDPVASQPDDLRSLGLVGPQQISTEAKMDPDTGALAAQVLENQAANSNYALGLLNVTQNGTGGTSVIPSAGAPQPTVITAGTDPTLASGGPGAITGLRFTTNAGGAGTLTLSRIYHLLKNLKPARFYGISFWYKADAFFNVRCRVGLSDGAGAFAAPNSDMTLDGVSAVDPLDVTIKNDGLWHRASLVVKTITGLDPDPAVLKYLQFRFEQGSLTTTAGQFAMTNIQVTEGEWIPGYMGCQYVPSGGIIMWDQSDTCPPGFQNIADAIGKFIVGSNTHVNPGDFGGPDFDPAASSGNTGGESNPHHHTIDNDPVTVRTDGAVTTALVQNGANDFDTQDESAGHTHAIPGATVPYYALKLCRAI